MKGKVFEGKLLKFYFVSHGDQPAPFLVAVNVSKRHGVAVRRNRIKRRIRESLRLLIRERYEELKTHHNRFSVVVVYKGMKGQFPGRVEFTDFRRDVSGFIDAIHSSNVGN